MSNFSLLSPPDSKELPKTVISKNTTALTEMVEGVAHELNNSVAIVLGNVQLIKLKNRDESVVEGLNRIERSIIKCSDLVKAIQHYAGDNTGRGGKIINLVDALTTALEFDETNWKEDASQKNLTVITNLTIDNCPIKSDLRELISAISHLLHNAVDSSPNYARINVTLKVRDELAVLTIADNGSGIDESIKAKIYEPFYSTKQIKGAGLGLTIVQSIVSRYGGRIGFSKNIPNGTIFTMSFPTRGPVSNLSMNDDDTGTTDVQRILIVDDDEEIRNVLSEMLLIEGYRPEHCPDAYCAMELLEKSSYDMIITDLGMPGMSGYDLAEYVHDKYKNIQIVLLTGWGSSIDREGRELKGVKAVLTKPFRLTQILELVHN